ncbi:MAG: AsnC family transcriptional regulator [Comamonas sp. SCN 67-35]|jgi:Lrp/AsnC family leucine-responsive transcriptional regulator|uniref:winged helix-turn-helix transcriptional regulator n=1 Tax=unclassified Comamonas TaxID=2638500 RepID=UPI00086B3249|nr:MULTISPECIES: winged helix-turn-helix transcriptional regulator [unclassified Comamonas]MBN9329377.1 winged helix-turn-helix transcriptional regulator [Comamonas sp.]MCD6664387.1 winged helix-turn-helix transcriptional regulator [Comamonas sp.]ODU39815.1 MAG: AsnC family transcriptional regulator [Comamonas sp. SCN 67-35]OJW95905.1 MAG: AsnC family transcriptional regulator [Burkholderiales bacterium 66-26]
MADIDRIDRKILDALQREGRLPMTELAQRIGLTTSPCTERVKRLEREGVIEGYHARVNPEALGRTLLVYVELTLSSKSTQIFDAVRQALLLEPRVLECHLISGSFDYLVKVRLTAMREYRELLGHILRQIPVPAQSNSYVVMEEIKENGPLTVPG